jgi:AcrR family transcriptional regulator
MPRPYTQKKRAEQQAETRRRIVEATLDLHSSIGPAQTTISMIAERAGVQRHTLYAHFPEEKGLFRACSGLALERDPMPDAAPWREIGDRAERLRTGLGEIYAWYGRNAEMAGCVLRDAEHHELTRDTVAERFGPSIAAWHEVLGEGLEAAQLPLLAVALSYFTWRTLVRGSALVQVAAVEAMVRAIGTGDQEHR